MSGGFFRGTSSEQDTRFSNKMAKLLKTQKFAPELDQLVDMSKVQMDVMRPWIAARVTELLGFEDEVLINFIYGLLDAKEVDGKHIQIQLTGFMEKNTGRFMKEMWSLLTSAQNNISGIPQQFLDAKAEETKKKKAEEQRIFSEIQRKKDQEKIAEEERQHKIDVENQSLKNAAALANASRQAHPGKLSPRGDREKSCDKPPPEAKQTMKNGRKPHSNSQSSSDPNSLSPSPTSSRDSPHVGRRRCPSRSISNSPLNYRASRSPLGRRHSAADKLSPRRPLRSPPQYRSPVRRRRSPSDSPAPARRRHAPALSPSPPSRRRYPHSPSPPRRRHLPYSRSPPRRRHSPRHVRSPSNRRVPLLRSRSPPVRHHSPVRRVRSPIQSLSPPRRSPPLSHSPLRNAHCRSPPRRMRSPPPPRSPARRSKPALLSRSSVMYPRSPKQSLSPVRRLSSPMKSGSPVNAESPIYPRSPSKETRSPVQSRSPARRTSSLAHSTRMAMRSPILAQSSPQHSISPSRSSSPARGRHIGYGVQTHSSPRPTHSPIRSPYENSVHSPLHTNSPSKHSGLSPCSGSPQPYVRKEPIAPVNFDSPKRKRFLHVSRSPLRTTQSLQTLSPFEISAVIQPFSPERQLKPPASSHSPRQSLNPRSLTTSSPERGAKSRDGGKADPFNGPLLQSTSFPNVTDNNHRGLEPRGATGNTPADRSPATSEERREAKRSRKEERRLRKEQKRKKREERKKRREERRAAKAAAKSNISFGGVSPRVHIEKDSGTSDSDNDVPETRPWIEDEEMESEQKRIENELRKKALESLRARKGILSS